MKNTPTNLAALSEIAAACEGTRWEFRYRVSEEHDWVYTQLSIRRDAPEYTPAVYFDEDWDLSGHIRIQVQTTSYGALSISEIGEVAAGLTEAAQLANRLAAIAALAGFRVTGVGTL